MVEARPGLCDLALSRCIGADRMHGQPAFDLRVATQDYPNRVGVGQRAVLVGVHNPVGDAVTCPTFAAIEVTAPGGHDPVRIRTCGYLCSGLSVHPVVAGNQRSLTALRPRPT